MQKSEWYLPVIKCFLIILTFKPAFGEDEPVDIWEKEENQKDLLMMEHLLAKLHHGIKILLYTHRI